MLKRRHGSIAILPMMIVGSIGLLNLMQRPRFAMIQTVDVVQLLGSGVCFGVALTVLIFWLRNRSAEKSSNAVE